jgi:ribosomal protein S18 acetylase RimI-like enzyme
MIIRQAKSKDSDQLINLMKELALFEGYSDNFKITKKTIEEQINHVFFALVAESDKQLVGYLLYYFLPFTYDLTPWLFIKELFVDDKYRGLKIGKKLMQQAEQMCQQKGGSRMTWSVLSSNYRAQKFYQSLGASHDNEWQIYSKAIK